MNSTPWRNLKFCRFSTLIVVIGLTTGCFAPVNLCYDSARMLDTAQVEVHGSVSGYTNGDDYQALNCGVKFGYGFTPRFNLKSRVEILDLPVNGRPYL